MAHELPQCHGPLFLRELGDVRLNLVVKFQTPLLEQQADGGRSEHGGGGSDPEPGIWRDAYAGLEIRPAKAFCPYDVATGTDGHRKARQVLLGEACAHDRSPAFHRIRPC
jgi:hypothetical protein